MTTIASSLDRRVRHGSHAVFALLLAVSSVVGAGTAHATTDPPCAPGEFCAWSEMDFSGARQRVVAEQPLKERCMPLPLGFEARSFANHTGHPVTVYADANCSTEDTFKTYPSGTIVPKAPYQGKAVKVWRH